MRTSSIPWVKDFLNRLPKEERKKVLSNLCKVRESLLDDHCFTDVDVERLDDAFLWGLSPQGFVYWSDLYERAYGG